MSSLNIPWGDASHRTGLKPIARDKLGRWLASHQGIFKLDIQRKKKLAFFWF